MKKNRKLKPGLLTDQMRVVREDVIGYINELWKEQIHYAEIICYENLPGQSELDLFSEFSNTDVRIVFNTITKMITVYYKKKQGSTDFLYELAFQLVPFESNLDESLQWKLAAVADEAFDKLIKKQGKSV